MPLQKNQLLTLRIERLSSDGSGVAHSPEGEAVFVPGTAPGDEAQVRIVKDCGRYAFGILDKLLTPSPDRIPVDCAVAGPCGSCHQTTIDPNKTDRPALKAAYHLQCMGCHTGMNVARPENTDCTGCHKSLDK